MCALGPVLVQAVADPDIRQTDQHLRDAALNAAHVIATLEAAKVLQSTFSCDWQHFQAQASAWGLAGLAAVSASTNPVEPSDTLGSTISMYK
jgi:hypothetical protein